MIYGIRVFTKKELFFARLFASAKTLDERLMIIHSMHDNNLVALANALTETLTKHYQKNDSNRSK